MKRLHLQISCLLVLLNVIPGVTGEADGQTIGNLVFLDKNNNGYYDKNDKGIEGVVVNLYRDHDEGTYLDANDEFIGTTTTDKRGKFEFTNLEPGYYQIDLPLSNMEPGGPLENMLSSRCGEEYDLSDPNNQIDNDDNGTQSIYFGVGTPWPIILGDPVNPEDNYPDSNLTVDFGFYRAESLSIGDRVFNDLNNNGLFEPEQGETGIKGVKLNLYRETEGEGADTFLDPTDELVATTTTTKDGFYRFESLTPGNYYVEAPLSNMEAGGPLENMISSSPDREDQFIDPNDPIDDDDNGKQHFYQGFGVCTPWELVISYGRMPSEEDGDGDRNTNLTIDFGFTAN